MELIHFHSTALPDFARAYYWLAASLVATIIITLTAYRARIWLLVPLDRWFTSMFMFHGHLMTAEFRVRAWALIHNFRPYCPRFDAAKTFISPAHQLNGFVYHDHWLHNLLISTSGGVIYAHHKKC